MTGPKILDLERLHEIYEDDREGIRDLLDLAVQMATAQLDAIATGLDGHDAAGIRAAAHAIKGATLNVGADEAAQLASALERAASAAQWDAIPDGVTALREGFARLKERIERFGREG